MVEKNLSVFKRLGCQQISTAQSAEGPVRTQNPSWLPSRSAHLYELRVSLFYRPQPFTVAPTTLHHGF